MQHREPCREIRTGLPTAFEGRSAIVNVNFDDHHIDNSGF
jgi:hypothetical protein